MESHHLNEGDHSEGSCQRGQEEVEEEAEAPARKSKRLVRGTAKVVVPASPKSKDLPKLDEVPRKKRNFLDASAAAAVKPSVSKLVTPTEVDMADMQLALPALETVVEEAPLEVQETPLETLEAQSPTLMI